MSKRWHPRGRGWVRTLDYGDVAAWMRPLPGGGLECIVYTGDGWGAYYEENVGEVWHVHCPRKSWMPKHIQDKPHRVRWVLDDSRDGDGDTLISRTIVLASHKGHRRLNWNRYINLWPLPRKLVRAIR